MYVCHWIGTHTLHCDVSTGSGKINFYENHTEFLGFYELYFFTSCFMIERSSQFVKFLGALLWLKEAPSSLCFYELYYDWKESPARKVFTSRTKKPAPRLPSILFSCSGLNVSLQFFISWFYLHSRFISCKKRGDIHWKSLRQKKLAPQFVLKSIDITWRWRPLIILTIKAMISVH